MDKRQEAILLLEQEKEELLRRVRSLDSAIETLSSLMLVPHHGSHPKAVATTSSYANGAVLSSTLNRGADKKYKHYYDAKSNKEKVIAILKAEGRFLHIRQITKIATELEPEVDAEQLIRQISGAVYNLKSMENSPLISYTVNNTNQNTFWGSKSWLNADGSIKPDHMYDENELSTKKVNSLEI